MFSYSQKSLSKLNSCHPDLKLIFETAIEYFDITIIEGRRSLETQEEYVRTGKSKTLNSKHLKQSDGYSHAVDAALYPIDWNNKEKFLFLGGFMIGISKILFKDGKTSHLVRWGGDWDKDGDTKEHSFFDGPHFELYKP